MRIRDATTGDAAPIAAIGTSEFARLHAPLMGPAAARVIVEQIYTEAAVAASIESCNDSEDAHFLVADRNGRVVGYLHFDSFGDEPELHRIYLAHDELGRGTGSLLMNELHDRLGPDGTYILLVAAANERARRFYAKHGLVEERLVADCNGLYGKYMGVQLPPAADPVAATVMRWKSGIQGTSDLVRSTS